jgi:hypothetical protein
MVTNPHTKGASNNSKQAGNEQEDISEVGNNKQQEDRSKAVADISDDGEVSMVDYDKIVYDITGGPPLAIAVLAGLVRHRESDLERKAVLDQLKPPCPMDKIFAASYDDLSQDLKSCFLYFAAYTKNIAQPADHIVRMWMAEGFVKPRDGRTPEELGHVYLLELASRRLVTRVGMELFIVHSRLLEFLQSEARQASFVEVHSRNDVLAPASVRRLSVQDDGYGYTPFTTKFPKLRTFICRVEVQGEEEQQQDGNQGSTIVQTTSTTSSRKSRWSGVLSCLEGVIPCIDTEGGPPQGRNGYHNLNFLRWSKFLRLICVQGLRLRELPDEIGDMTHLRYLRVRGGRDLAQGLGPAHRSVCALLSWASLLQCFIVENFGPGLGPWPKWP